MAKEAEVYSSPCLICSGIDYVWGYLFGAAGAKVSFHPDGPMFSLRSTNESIRVRKCEGCGNIQCFSEE